MNIVIPNFKLFFVFLLFSYAAIGQAVPSRSEYPDFSGTWEMKQNDELRDFEMTIAQTTTTLKIRTSYVFENRPTVNESLVHTDGRREFVENLTVTIQLPNGEIWKPETETTWQKGKLVTKTFPSEKDASLPLLLDSRTISISKDLKTLTIVTKYKRGKGPIVSNSRGSSSSSMLPVQVVYTYRRKSE